MENWSKNVSSTIDSKLEGIREKEIRFYRIDELKRNIARIDSFSDSCPYCKDQKVLISEVVEKIDEAVNVPGKTRREYDRLISRIAKHIQKEHGFYTPFYFSYLFSFFGIVIGLIIGYFLIQLQPALWIEMLSLGFIIGLVPSYVFGLIKDKKIRAEKRLM